MDCCGWSLLQSLVVDHVECKYSVGAGKSITLLGRNGTFTLWDVCTFIHGASMDPSVE